MGDEILIDSATPEFMEGRRQAAMTALANAKIALGNGMVKTVLTALVKAEDCMRAMAPGGPQ